MPTAIVDNPAPKNPSHVFFGEMEGNKGCLPTVIPKK
jgi:hypothetical protein